MSAIPKSDRETLSETEFLARVAAHGIDIRKSGSRRWFYSPNSRRRRNGWPESPQETIDYVRNFTVPFGPGRGEPVLKFVGSRALPDRVGLAYSEAGKEWRALIRAWGRRVSPGVLINRIDDEGPARW